MPNKRQRKKNARKILKTGKAYNPKSTFRSSLSIKSTLFDPNQPSNSKMIMLAESNLNRLAFMITKPDSVNLTNLTKDEVKYLTSNQFFNNVKELQEYFNYNKAYYRPEKQQKVNNIIRTVINNYYQNSGISSVRGLDKSIRKLVRKLKEAQSKYNGTKGSPFVIVYYNDLDLR